MKISTEIGSIAKITGEERAVEYVARAGFDAWDFSMFQMCLYDWENRKAKKTNHPLAGADYAAFAKRLRKVGEDNGIVCNQAHAPFPTVCGEIRSYFKRAIECTAIAGGKICVIHPENDKSAEENAEIFQSFCRLQRNAELKSQRKICGTGTTKTARHSLPPAQLPKALTSI